MCPHCGQPFGVGPSCQYCGYPAATAGSRPSRRGCAYTVLGLVSLLVAGLVIWRVADPPTSAGSPVAGATDQLPPTPATLSTTDTSTTDTSTTDTSTSDTSTTDSPTTDSQTSPPTSTRGQSSGAATSGVLKIGLTSLPTTTDPATDSAVTPVIWHQVFDTMTTYRGSSATPAPDLATSWVSASSGKVWTFRIVAGKKFHDGVPVTAKAVCDNFNFWNSVKGDAQPEYYDWTYYFRGFAGQPGALFTSCKDAGASAVLTFARSMPALPDILTLESFGIHSPSSLAVKKPVGSGPYQWVSASPTTVVLRSSGPGSGRTTTLQFLQIADSAALAAAVRNGEIQLSYRRGVPQGADAGVTAQPPPGDLQVSLNLYGGHGPLADDKVRAAVVAAVDRRAIAGAVRSEPASSVLPAIFGGPRPPFPAPNPAAASSVLKGKGVVLTMGVRSFGSSGTEPAIAQLISAQLADVGVSVKMKMYNSVSSYYEEIQAGKVDLSIGQVQAYMGDRGDFVSVYAPNAAFGWVLPKNTRGALGNQIAQALSRPENEARQAASSAVLTELLRQNAVLPLFTTGGTWLVGSGVDGFQPALFNTARLDTVSVR